MSFDYLVSEITANKAFEIMYNAYKFLGNAKTNPGSGGTYELLKKIKRSDKITIKKCYKKMIEEENEAEGVILGIHSDKKYNRKDTMINETSQFLYWPTLLAVGNNVAYNDIRLLDFLERGFSGKFPVEIPKEIFESNLKENSTENDIVILRRSAAKAGKLLFDFNYKLGNECGQIEPKDIALWEWKQMLKKPYFYDYFDKILFG